jgi:hypothetical protein
MIIKRRKEVDCMVFELFLQNKEKELQKNKLRKERKKM